MLDWLKYIPMIMQVIDVGTKVRQSIRSGTPVLTVLKEEAPTVLTVVEDIGKVFWPNLTAPSQIEATAMKIWDQDYVRGVQTNLNKLGAEPKLKIDGDYGEKTKAAVTAFQTKMKFVPADIDGWAGPITKAALQTEANKLKPA